MRMQSRWGSIKGVGDEWYMMYIDGTINLHQIAVNTLRPELNGQSRVSCQKGPICHA